MSASNPFQPNAEHSPDEQKSAMPCDAYARHATPSNACIADFHHLHARTPIPNLLASSAHMRAAHRRSTAHFLGQVCSHHMHILVRAFPMSTNTCVQHTVALQATASGMANQWSLDGLIPVVDL